MEMSIDTRSTNRRASSDRELTSTDKAALRGNGVGWRFLQRSAFAAVWAQPSTVCSQ